MSISKTEFPSDISDKDISATKSEVWGNHFSVEEGSWKCGVCVVLNQKVGNKCAACETEQPGNERKLDVSVGADGSEALEDLIRAALAILYQVVHSFYIFFWVMRLGQKI